jgi:hypothetical protein
MRTCATNVACLKGVSPFDFADVLVDRQRQPSAMKSSVACASFALKVAPPRIPLL